MRSNPIQVGGKNCGLFTALAAEVFCSNAEGQFVYQPTHPDSVTCDGPAGDFLLRPTAWFSEGDVAFGRQLLQSMVLDLWQSQNRSDEGFFIDEEIREMQVEARVRLNRSLGKDGYPTGQLWYVYVVSSQQYQCEISRLPTELWKLMYRTIPLPAGPPLYQ